MGDKMQSSGENSNENRSNHGILTKSVDGKKNLPLRRKKKHWNHPDKEESKCLTVNVVSTKTTKEEGSFSKTATASIEHNNTDLGQNRMPKTKRILSGDNQLSTLANINNDQHISSENNNSFKKVCCSQDDSKHSIAKGHPDFSKWSASSGNKQQCGKCCVSSGTERKTPKITSFADLSDFLQRFLNLNSYKYVPPPDQSLPNLSTQGSKHSNINSEPLLVSNSPASSSTSGGHPQRCLKLEHDDIVDTFCFEAAIPVKAGVSIADVLCTDNNKGGCTHLSEETSEQGPSADLSDVKQSSLNLNSYKYVSPPDQSLPDLPTYGSKQIKSEQLLAINSPKSSAADDQPPGFKSEHDYTTELSNGIAILVQVGDSKVDVLDIVKDKGGSTDPSQQTSQQGPSGDPTVVEKPGHANTFKAGGKARSADSHTELQNVPKWVEEQGNSNIVEAGGKARSAGFNIKLQNVRKAHEALDYFVRSNAVKNVVTETNRSSNNSLCESRQAYEVPYVSKEGGLGKYPEEPPLKEKYGKYVGKHPSDNSNNNKYSENSTRSYVDSRSSRSGDNSKNISIALSKKSIQQSGQGHRQTSEDTWSKTMGESASSVVQPLNANLQEYVEALSANGSNTKQQDNNKLVDRCAELEKLVSKLQCENDEMKEKIETLEQGHYNLKYENKQLIKTCDVLVDPLIKELPNKESVWKIIVRHVSGCAELEQLVKKLQCDNDLMKKEMEGVRRRNSNLENENVNAKKSLEGSLQVIEKCDALVDPVIKELQNKELLWKTIVRYATGKTLMSDNILGKIGHICDYAKTVNNKIVDLTYELKEKKVAIVQLRNHVADVQFKMKKLDEHFQQKPDQKLQVIMETDVKLKNELEAKKNIEDKLKASAECIKKYKKGFKNYEGQSELIELLKQNLHEKSQTIKDLEKHSQLLQNILKDAAHQLEYYNEQMKSTHGGLQAAERNFLRHFESFKTGITEYSKMLSLEQNSKQAEMHFIDHALLRIIEIKKGAEQYEFQIKEFGENRESKTYLHIREMLQRRIEQLDTVESCNCKEILTMHREAKNYIKTLCADLERKVISY